MVEVVEGKPLTPAGLRLRSPLPAAVKGVGETAKEGGHADVRLGPTPVAGRVDKDGLPRPVEQHVAAPKVAVEQGWRLGNYSLSREDKIDKLEIELLNGGSHTITGTGNGVVAAFVDAMSSVIGKPIVLVEYSEHALSQSADAEAVCYIQLNIEGERYCGCGRSHDIVQASLDGILRAINKAAEQDQTAAA